MQEELDQLNERIVGLVIRMNRGADMYEGKIPTPPGYSLDDVFSLSLRLLLEYTQACDERRALLERMAYEVAEATV